MAGAVMIDTGSKLTRFRSESNDSVKQYHSGNFYPQNRHHNCTTHNQMATSNETGISNHVDDVITKVHVKDVVPEHPTYQQYSSRLESFVSWPRKYVPKTPEELATAGFFYIGSADRVTCFQCGITLRDWEQEHDPVTEHRRYAPKCDFISQTNVYVATRTTGPGAKSGASFTDIAAVTESDPPCSNLDCITDLITSDIECDSPVDYPVGSNRVYFGEGACVLVDDVIGQTMSGPMNDSELDTKISCGLSVSVADDIIAEECVRAEATKSSRKSKQFASLLSENKRLKEQTTCRVCMSQAAAILFLPCGHLVTCPDCADSVTDCVMCGKTVLGTVKTFRA